MERYDLVTHHELSEIRGGPALSIADLERAQTEIKSAGKCFRMLILTTPDNPTGGIYSHEQLLKYTNWCIDHGIHLVVNEIYGLSLINTEHSVIREDYTEDTVFCSFANIMQAKQSDLLHLPCSRSTHRRNILYNMAGNGLPPINQNLRESRGGCTRNSPSR